ncbi:hypothetical protein QVD17_31658 [Tagetes erecta]|uniref:HMA domain-containing protein n=1 Tax=Tagetes erecta TaxID=13708 RepID=A0AAD8KA95_TARER|nr:hypothetical protein QVD17_31658 [Tagetes erecta]
MQSESAIHKHVSFSVVALPQYSAAAAAAAAAVAAFLSHLSNARAWERLLKIVDRVLTFHFNLFHRKNKNKNNNGNNNSNNHGNTEEQKPEETQKHEENNKVDGAADEKPNEPKSENNNKQKQNAGAIVLGVYLHCEGCVKTVVKSLRGFDGVEEIQPNTKDHRVTVKGKSADAVRVAERVRRKTGKHVDIISPVQKKQPEKKPEKKPEVPKVTEVVLKMHLHCEGCAKDVKHCIHKMEGVQTVNADMEKSLVTVKGTFDPKNIVPYISKRAGRHAEIVNPKNTKKDKKDGEQKDENEKNEKKDKEKDAKNLGSPYPNAPPGLVYAPQLFSDENPNACSVM